MPIDAMRGELRWIGLVVNLIHSRAMFKHTIKAIRSIWTKEGNAAETSDVNRAFLWDGSF